MTHDRFDYVHIREGNKIVEVHGPDDPASHEFVVATNDPDVFDSDVVRQAIAVSGMLVAAPTWPIRRWQLADEIPGDTDENLALTREMRDNDYAPLRTAGVPQHAPTYGTVGLTDTDDAVDFLGFLGTLGIAVEVHY